MRKFTAAIGAALVLGIAAAPALAQSNDTQAVTSAAEKLRVAMVDPDQATLRNWWPNR